MKKLLIAATIVSLFMTPFCAYAQNGESASLSGVYDVYNEIRIQHTIETVASIQWYSAASVSGSYTAISGATDEVYIPKNTDSGRAIKAILIDAQGKTYETKPQVISAEWATRISPKTIGGALAQTPADYCFTVDGQEFILLNETEDAKSHFLIMSKNKVGKRIYSKINQQFTDMCAFLNNQSTPDLYYLGSLTHPTVDDYSQTGYIGNESYTQLPQSVMSSINFNHFWKIEPISSGQVKERNMRAGIVLPAMTEINRYLDRIGWDLGDYWLRTPSGSVGGDVLYIDHSQTGKVASAAFSEEKDLYPMFYLKQDFFLKNKLTKMGDGVIDMLGKSYTKEQLLTLYSEEELKELGYISFRLNSISARQDGDEVIVSLHISNRIEANLKKVALVAAYDEKGMLAGVTLDTLICDLGELTKDVVIGDVSQYSSLMAVFLDSETNLVPVTPAVFK